MLLEWPQLRAQPHQPLSALLQIQELDSVSSISIVGTVGMVTAVSIALVKLLLLKKPEGHHRVANTGQDFKIAMVALFDIVSAGLLM